MSTGNRLQVAGYGNRLTGELFSSLKMVVRTMLAISIITNTEIAPWR
jgi:hypothetical protein